MNKEEYVTEMDKLLADWKEDADKKSGNPVFFIDGVVDPDTYYKQDKRLLFVLKEAYATENTADLINEADWLSGNHEGAIKSQTFKRIAMWTGITFGDEKIEQTYKWDDLIFRKIALINIKKYDGKRRSDNKNLEEHATDYAEKIIKQIELINPTIIICGYTRWLLDIALKKCGKPTIKEGEQKSQYTYQTTKSFNNETVTVIDFWHPSCRKNNDFLNKALSKSLNFEDCLTSHTEKGGRTPSEVGPKNK